MSRCFPYPPPGYSRSGASYEALIESIKLQKDNDKAKAERKKEKRSKKEKKDKKEKRKGSEKSKVQKSLNEGQQDSHCKELQTSVNLKEQSLPLNLKGKESTIEHLEKSDLTEEHGQPVDSQKPSYSSDSTQNSNKRKRDDPVEPDGSNPVKPIKIRFFKKQKGPDSIKETSCSNSVLSVQPNLSSQDARLNGINVPLVQSTSNSVGGQRTPLVSSNRKTGNSSASRSYDRKQTVLPLSSGRSILPSSKTELPVSLQTKKNDVAVHRSSRQQSIPIPDPSYRRPLEHEIPITSVLPPAPSVSRKNDATVVSSSGRMLIDEIKAPINNEKKKDPISEIPLNVAPTRTQKKMMKKHSKYEKLIGSWVPPVLEAQVAVDVGGDDDWLLGSRTTRTARSASLTDDVETCRESLWQPCARFLVEGDMYAMPYTVPF